MFNKISPALERCKQPVYLGFFCCNLDEQAVLRFATAVENVTSIFAIYCVDNPGNNAHTHAAMRRAIIANKSPIELWNGEVLPKDIVQAWRARVAAAAPPPMETHTSEEFSASQRALTQISQSLNEKQVKLAENQAILVQLLDMANKFQKQCEDVKRDIEALQTEKAKHETIVERGEAVKRPATVLNGGSGERSAKQQRLQEPCSICFDNAINASLLCGHRFCRTCADKMFRSQKKECPNCRKRIEGVIPSF